MVAQQSIHIGDTLLQSRVGFGAMRITGKGIWGWPKDKRRVRKLLSRVRELGIVFIDTADSYGPEISEYLIQEFLTPYDGIFIASKGGMQRGGPRSWINNGRPSYLKIACINSLRRLQVDQLDLYQLHAPDSAVPIEDSVGALRSLQEEGHIRYIGVSNVNIDQLKRAQREANIVSVQNRYSLADRTHEPVLQYCKQEGIAFIPWYPLDMGKLARDDTMTMLAKKHKARPAQLALAWLMHHGTNILPIPGTASVAHLEQNFACTKISLSKKDMSEIEKLKAL